ncbi:hypothetical protein EK21DRAFT_73336 [Setomelanomma holmii]|uniref:Protein kinase domain-containing protein n=1 Tax=Setomelanomma holmii TaxID=210430 RepID=A0A9P4H3X4_9PLEO|nr:hypothetical protein EK21DRAFT_73336 [Setomelanomma holmii]
MDSTAVDEIAHQATTRLAVGATDFAEIGSHLDSPPPPKIRVDQHEESGFGSQSPTGNVLAYRANANLAYCNSFQDCRCSLDGNIDPSKAAGDAARQRADSLCPYATSEHGVGASAESSSSTHIGPVTCEDVTCLLPPIRRNSHWPDMKTATRTNTTIKNDAEHRNAVGDDSASDSTPVYSDQSSDGSDTDVSRPYTRSRTLRTQIPNLSHANSEVSDAGIQNSMEQASDAGHEQSQDLSDIVPTASSSRYALQRAIYATMVTARNDDAALIDQQFFPRNQLSRVINPSTVYAELLHHLPREYSESGIRELAYKICDITSCKVNGKLKRRSHRSIFAILVLAERSRLIVSFLHNKVSDLDLPLEPIKERGCLIGMRQRGTSPDGSQFPPLQCFDDEEWSPASLGSFERYQWYMLAPYFSHGRHGQINYYPLHDQQILPFESSHQAEDDAAESQGGYGRVMMVRIHPAHHRLGRNPSSDYGFAVKQLLSNDRKSFKKEKEMLKKFSGARSHPHIVSLLATYRHRSKYHFIFDRAQSDLGRFWEMCEQAPELSQGDVLWVSKQCLGIADGLFRIHQHKTFKVRRKRILSRQEELSTSKKQVTFVENASGTSLEKRSSVGKRGAKHPNVESQRPASSDMAALELYEIRYGRHGDINPQNILWFTDDLANPAIVSRDLRGLLKIADFGTAEMNSTYSKSGPRDVANTMTYRPPECDAADRTIRQSFDIWCLGCVYLEFVTWMLGGAALVRKFAQKRMSRDPVYGNDETDTYFELIWNKDTRKTEARVKPSVIEVLSRMNLIVTIADQVL